MDLSILDKIDLHKAEIVAGKIGVRREVLCGWLIDGRAPKSAIEKMAVVFNCSFDDLVTCPCELSPRAYTRNRQRWEQSSVDSEQHKSPSDIRSKK